MLLACAGVAVGVFEAAGAGGRRPSALGREGAPVGKDPMVLAHGHPDPPNRGGSGIGY